MVVDLGETIEVIHGSVEMDNAFSFAASISKKTSF